MWRTRFAKDFPGGQQSGADSIPPHFEGAHDGKNAPETQGATSDAKLDSILEVINTSREILESKIDKVAVDLCILRDNHCQLTESKRNEVNLEEVHPTVDKLQKQISTWHKGKGCWRPQ